MRIHGLLFTTTMWKLFLLSFAPFAAASLESEEMYEPGPLHPHLKMTFFPPLENVQIKLEDAEEADYPWIARLIHSTKESIPHVGTATCIGPRLFVSAARSIVNLKVAYTRVLYKSEFIPVRAFVVPSRPSKQAYQDIGFLVTQPFEPADGKWVSLAPFSERNRTDGLFKWYHDMHLEENREDYYAVGYALSRKRPLNYKAPYHLYALNIVIGMNLCNKLTRWDETSDDYVVPCYHSCTVVEQKHGNAQCLKYLGVEGGALVNIKTNTLMGIATWGAYTMAHNLPVGFAIPNSSNFYRDLACALKIRADKTELVHRDLYQTICDGYHKSKHIKL